MGGKLAHPWKERTVAEVNVLNRMLSIPIAVNHQNQMIQDSGEGKGRERGQKGWGYKHKHPRLT